MEKSQDMQGFLNKKKKNKLAPVVQMAETSGLSPVKVRVRIPLGAPKLRYSVMVAQKSLNLLV